MWELVRTFMVRRHGSAPKRRARLIRGLTYEVCSTFSTSLCLAVLVVPASPHATWLAHPTVVETSITGNNLLALMAVRLVRSRLWPEHMSWFHLQAWLFKDL
jgi:hypothetical protein